MKPVVLSLIAAFGFGVWPVVSNFAGYSTKWLVIIISGLTFLGVVIYYAFSPESLQFHENPKKIGWIIGAGIINVIAWVFYGNALSSGAPLSSILPIIGIGIPVFSFVVACLLLGEAVTFQKLSGLILGILAVYLLS